MSIFKCKMCGGSLDIKNNETIATCLYCGSKQTLPKLDTDEKASLFDRANHYRRNNDFDSAMSIYEHMLQMDNNDSEIYWSLVLSRYGIEYVEDPLSHKRIPTINRTQYKSILDDDDYIKALQLADSNQKEIYINEANTIGDIQKGILKVSSKEEPFDIFICYKETDNVGRRTEDSVLAQEIYKELTNEGYKVFFSRITLEDKIGTAYEPYIFAALNSSKVMLVIGTKEEYFNAIWVKNEWSRYLSLINQGQNKILVPCFKNIDPYSLPKEFQYLQAQDMSKLGYVQDLLRGIEKIVKPNAKQEQASINNNNGNVDSLLKRAFIFLEDEEWDKADEYFEKILDHNPENAQAYLGKLMAKFQVNKKEKLKDVSKSFEDDNDYRKIIRYGDLKLKEEIINYVTLIKEKIKENELNENLRIYKKAKELIALNKKKEYISAIELLKQIPNWEDSNVLLEECRQKLSMLLLYDDKEIELGYYKQNGDNLEPIKWIVLDVNDESGKALLISKYALDYQKYNFDYQRVNWENSTIRQWLNNDFINESFTLEEQKIIISTNLAAEKSWSNNTDADNNTMDKIFLLSIDEVEKYLTDSDKKKCKATDYCIKKGAITSTQGFCFWWLRSPGKSQNLKAYININGTINKEGDEEHIIYHAIRPALWVNLDYKSTSK